jgi:hypothetical protein
VPHPSPFRQGNASSGAFTFSGSVTTGHGAEIQIVAFSNGVQGVYLYINADKAPEAIISIVSDHALTASDFVLTKPGICSLRRGVEPANVAAVR